jgi:Putative lumazine-binding
MAAAPTNMLAVLAASTAAVSLAACGEAVSTSSFKGPSHEVAQTLSDFQKDATAGDEAKLCQHDLAAKIATSLKRGGGCQAALKDQLKEVDSLNLTVESIAVNGASAQAKVKSTWSGKSKVTTLTLVKEGARWKISGASG